MKAQHIFFGTMFQLISKEMKSSFFAKSELKKHNCVKALTRTKDLEKVLRTQKNRMTLRWRELDSGQTYFGIKMY